MTGAATNLTLLSYRNDLNIGIAMDPKAVTERSLFIDCLRDGFEEVTNLV